MNEIDEKKLEEEFTEADFTEEELADEKVLDERLLSEIAGGRDLSAFEAEVLWKKKSYYKAKFNLGHISQQEYWRIEDQIMYYEKCMQMVSNDRTDEIFTLSIDWRQRFFDLEAAWNLLHSSTR